MVAHLHRSGRTWLVLACLFLAVVTIGTYAPVVRFDFVSFDDPAYVTENPAVLQGLGWPGFVWALMTTHAANWHPLTWLSHQLDMQLWGLKAGAHHGVNLALHTTNAVLLFLWLQQMTGARWRSLLVAGLFALHPLHTESVAWVAERKDVLSTFFGLLAFIAYTRYAGASKPGQANAGNAPTAETIRPLRSYFLALLLYACSLMSKPTLVTLPFFLLLIDFWPLQRWQSPVAVPSGGRRLMVEKLPFLALAVASSGITLWAQQRGGAVVSFEHVSLPSRFANAAVAYATYLARTVWPADLAFYYPRPPHQAVWNVAVAAGILMLISLAVLATRRRYLVAGWLWFLGTLTPMIGLVQVGDQASADRYTYWPLTGVFIATVWGLGELATRLGLKSGAQRLAGAGVILTCALLCRAQVSYWRSDESLCRRALAATANNFVAYDTLASYYWQHGQAAAAIENCRKSLAIRARFEPLNNLGLMLASQGDFTNAIAAYQAALQQRPAEPGARQNLARAFVQCGRLEDAAEQYRVLLRAEPTDLAALNGLGIVLSLQGNLDQAIAQFRKVIAADPNQASAHGNLANALASQNKIAEATEEFGRYVQLQPQDPVGHLGLARGLLAQQKVTEAIEHLNKAVELRPEMPELHYELGMALERQGQTQAARQHFQTALRLRPEYPEARARLGTVNPPD